MNKNARLPSGFYVRPLSERDAEKSFDLWQLVAGRESYGVTFLRKQLREQYNCTHLGGFDARGRVTGLVTLGWLGVYGKLLGLIVLPETRRTGVGKALVQAACLRARSINLSHIDLEVMSENLAAISLYEETGFVMVDRSESSLQYRCKLDQ